MPTLYALVCGIDQYRDPVPPLQGCVNDASMVADYLRQNVPPQKMRLELVTLYDAQATRQNIVEHFRQHLGQARTGDTALFFFAGHGGQEIAHEFFAEYEPDGKLETILCYDSRHDGVRDLADKELRHLLHGLSGPDPENAPHVVVLQDNCHSGSGVRSDESAGQDADWTARTVRATPLPRTWEEFLFAADYPLDQMARSARPDRLLPLGRVVQLAACLSNEYAWETTHHLPDGRTFKGGIFTRRLLETLHQHHGQLTYHDLQSKIRGRIGGNGEATQTPNLYVSTHPGDAFRTFLYGEGNEKPTYCNVQWNNYLGWHMDIGAFQRVPSDPRTQPVQVLVRESLQSPKVYRAQTVAVEAGRSRLAFVGEAPPQDLALIGEVPNLRRDKLRVFFDAPVRRDGHLDRLVQTAGERLKPLLDGLAAVATEAEAQYVVRSDGRQYFFSLPGDPRPLARQQGPPGEPAVLRVLEQLSHAGQWENTRALFNPATRLRPLPPVLLECFVADAPDTQPPLPIRDGILRLESPTRPIKIGLRNLSPRTLFVGALMMDKPFGASAAPVAGQVARLEKNQSVYLDFGTGNPQLTLRVPAFLGDFGWTEYDFFLKIFISTCIFDLATLQMPPLPAPVADNRTPEDEAPQETTRGFTPMADMPDWAAYTVKVVISDK